jgi:hypothetical protein
VANGPRNSAARTWMLNGPIAPAKGRTAIALTNERRVECPEMGFGGGNEGGILD